ncbi:hypothetical protein A3Q56_03245, partial [Intoshia linei]
EKEQIGKLTSKMEKKNKQLQNVTNLINNIKNDIMNYNQKELHFKINELENEKNEYIHSFMILKDEYEKMCKVTEHIKLTDQLFVEFKDVQMQIISLEQKHENTCVHLDKIILNNESFHKVLNNVNTIYDNIKVSSDCELNVKVKSLKQNLEILYTLKDEESIVKNEYNKLIKSIENRDENSGNVNIVPSNGTENIENGLNLYAKINENIEELKIIKQSFDKIYDMEEELENEMTDMKNLITKFKMWTSETLTENDISRKKIKCDENSKLIHIKINDIDDMIVEYNDCMNGLNLENSKLDKFENYYESCLAYYKYEKEFMKRLDDIVILISEIHTQISANKEHISYYKSKLNSLDVNSTSSSLENYTISIKQIYDQLKQIRQDVLNFSLNNKPIIENLKIHSNFDITDIELQNQKLINEYEMLKSEINLKIELFHNIDNNVADIVNKFNIIDNSIQNANNLNFKLASIDQIKNQVDDINQIKMLLVTIYSDGQIASNLNNFESKFHQNLIDTISIDFDGKKDLVQIEISKLNNIERTYLNDEAVFTKMSILNEKMRKFVSRWSDFLDKLIIDPDDLDIDIEKTKSLFNEQMQNFLNNSYYMNDLNENINILNEKYTNCKKVGCLKSSFNQLQQDYIRITKLFNEYDHKLTNISLKIDEELEHSLKNLNVELIAIEKRSRIKLKNKSHRSVDENKINKIIEHNYKKIENIRSIYSAYSEKDISVKNLSINNYFNEIESNISISTELTKDLEKYSKYNKNVKNIQKSLTKYTDELNLNKFDGRLLVSDQSSKYDYISKKKKNLSKALFELQNESLLFNDLNSEYNSFDWSINIHINESISNLSKSINEYIHKIDEYSQKEFLYEESMRVAENLIYKFDMWQDGTKSYLNKIGDKFENVSESNRRLIFADLNCIIHNANLMKYNLRQARDTLNVNNFNESLTQKDEYKNLMEKIDKKTFQHKMLTNKSKLIVEQVGETLKVTENQNKSIPELLQFQQDYRSKLKNLSLKINKLENILDQQNFVNISDFKSQIELVNHELNDIFNTFHSSDTETSNSNQFNIKKLLENRIKKISSKFELTCLQKYQDCKKSNLDTVTSYEKIMADNMESINQSVDDIDAFINTQPIEKCTKINETNSNITYIESSLNEIQDKMKNVALSMGEMDETLNNPHPNLENASNDHNNIKKIKTKFVNVLEKLEKVSMKGVHYIERNGNIIENVGHNIYSDSIRNNNENLNNLFKIIEIKMENNNKSHALPTQKSKNEENNLLMQQKLIENLLLHPDLNIKLTKSENTAAILNESNIQLNTISNIINTFFALKNTDKVPKIPLNKSTFENLNVKYLTKTYEKIILNLELNLNLNVYAKIVQDLVIFSTQLLNYFDNALSINGKTENLNDYTNVDNCIEITKQIYENIKHVIILLRKKVSNQYPQILSFTNALEYIKPECSFLLKRLNDLRDFKQNSGVNNIEIEKCKYFIEKFESKLLNFNDIKNLNSDSQCTLMVECNSLISSVQKYFLENSRIEFNLRIDVNHLKDLMKNLCAKLNTVDNVSIHQLKFSQQFSYKILLDNLTCLENSLKFKFKSLSDFTCYSNRIKNQYNFLKCDILKFELIHYKTDKYDNAKMIDYELIITKMNKIEQDYNKFQILMEFSKNVYITFYQQVNNLKTYMVKCTNTFSNFVDGILHKSDYKSKCTLLLEKIYKVSLFCRLNANYMCNHFSQNDYMILEFKRYLKFIDQFIEKFMDLQNKYINDISAYEYCKFAFINQKNMLRCDNVMIGIMSFSKYIKSGQNNENDLLEMLLNIKDWMRSLCTIKNGMRNFENFIFAFQDVFIKNESNFNNVHNKISKIEIAIDRLEKRCKHILLLQTSENVSRLREIVVKLSKKLEIVVNSKFDVNQLRIRNYMNYEDQINIVDYLLTVSLRNCHGNSEIGTVLSRYDNMKEQFMRFYKQCSTIDKIESQDEYDHEVLQNLNIINNFMDNQIFTGSTFCCFDVSNDINNQIDQLKIKYEGINSKHNLQHTINTHIKSVANNVETNFKQFDLMNIHYNKTNTLQQESYMLFNEYYNSVCQHLANVDNIIKKDYFISTIYKNNDQIEVSKKLFADFQNNENWIQLKAMQLNKKMSDTFIDMPKFVQLEKRWQDCSHSLENIICDMRVKKNVADKMIKRIEDISIEISTINYSDIETEVVEIKERYKSIVNNIDSISLQKINDNLLKIENGIELINREKSSNHCEEIESIRQEYDELTTTSTSTIDEVKMIINDTSHMLEEFKNDSKISDKIGKQKDLMYLYYRIISKKIYMCDHFQNKLKLKKDILLTYDGHENVKKNLQVCKNQVIESIYVLEQKCSSQMTFQKKCDNWVSFLKNIDKMLLIKFTTNIDDMMDHYFEFCLFFEKLNFNDPILIAIINEGKMLFSGEDENESSNSSMYSTNLCESQKNYINELNSSFIDWGNIKKRFRHRKDLILQYISVLNLFKMKMISFNEFNELLHEKIDKIEIKKTESIYSINRKWNLMLGFDCEINHLKWYYNEIVLLSQSILTSLSAERATDFLNIREQLCAAKNSFKRLAQQSTDKLNTILHCMRKSECINSMYNRVHQLTSEIVTFCDNDQITADINILKLNEIKCSELSTTLNYFKQNIIKVMYKFTNGSLENAFKTKQLNSIAITEFEDNKISLIHKQINSCLDMIQVYQTKIQTCLKSWKNFDVEYSNLVSYIGSVDEKLKNLNEKHVNVILKHLNMLSDQMKDVKSRINNLENISDKLVYDCSSVSYTTIIKLKMNHLHDYGNHMTLTIRNRTANLNDIIRAFDSFDKMVYELRSWMNSNSINTLYNANLSIQKANVSVNDIYNRYQRDYEDMKIQIINRSTSINAIIGLCEILQTDKTACPNEKDRLDMKRTIEHIEYFWNKKCKMVDNMRIKIEKFIKYYKFVANNIKKVHTITSNFVNTLKNCASKRNLPERLLKLNEIEQEIKKCEEKVSAFSKKFSNFGNFNLLNKKVNSLNNLISNANFIIHNFGKVEVGIEKPVDVSYESLLYRGSVSPMSNKTESENALNDSAMNIDFSMQLTGDSLEWDGYLGDIEPIYSKSNEGNSVVKAIKYLGSLVSFKKDNDEIDNEVPDLFKLLNFIRDEISDIDKLLKMPLPSTIDPSIYQKNRHTTRINQINVLIKQASATNNKFKKNDSIYAKNVNSLKTYQNKLANYTSLSEKRDEALEIILNKLKNKEEKFKSSQNVYNKSLEFFNQLDTKQQNIGNLIEVQTQIEKLNDAAYSIFVLKDNQLDSMKININNLLYEYKKYSYFLIENFLENKTDENFTNHFKKMETLQGNVNKIVKMKSTLHSDADNLQNILTQIENLEKAVLDNYSDRNHSSINSESTKIFTLKLGNMKHQIQRFLKN